MTPLEISEYKRSWMSQSNNAVPVHSDLDVQCKAWCRKNLQRHEWSMTQYTNVYEHTFYFEDPANSQEFKLEFNKWLSV